MKFELHNELIELLNLKFLNELKFLNNYIENYNANFCHHNWDGKKLKSKRGTSWERDGNRFKPCSGATLNNSYHWKSENIIGPLAGSETRWVFSGNKFRPQTGIGETYFLSKDSFQKEHSSMEYRLSAPISGKDRIILIALVQ